MVRNFKGVVRVADVQAEFDNLLTIINDAIDRYNAALDAEDIDFNNAGAELAALGYTLTVGGLKTVLEAYNGALIGGQVFQEAPGAFIVSEGLYIKDGTITRLPSKPVAGSGNILYYNTQGDAYSFSNISSETGYYQTIVTDTTSPTISGSNSAALGSLSSSVEATYDGTNKFLPYMAFPSNSVKRFSPLVTNGTEYTLIWQFNNPTELQNISFRYGIFGGGNMQVLDLNNNVLLSDSVSGTGVNATKDYTGTFNTGTTKYNGIKIRLYGFNTAYLFDAIMAFSTFTLGNISLTGKTTTTVYVPASAGDPEDFIPITKVNTNRISKLCNTQKATNEHVPDYEFTIANHTRGYDEGIEALSNSTKGQFVCGMEEVAPDGTTRQANLFGTRVSYNDRTSGNGAGAHYVSYWIPTNYLFIPKGIANPYTGASKQRVFDYNLERPNRTS